MEQGAAQEREKAALISELEAKLQGKIAHCKSFSEVLSVLCGVPITGGAQQPRRMHAHKQATKTSPNLRTQAKQASERTR